VAGSHAYGARAKLPLAAGATDAGPTLWSCHSICEAIWYAMASGLVSDRNWAAATEKGDEDPRSTASAPWVTQSRVFTKEATFVFP